jgi:class 3 adenylate cyclase/alpha-beta hydrolase superfamily lysophospholipase
VASHGGLSYARTTDGAHLAFEVVGSGAHPVLFAPGGSTSLEDWRLPAMARAEDRLGTFARFVRFDERGVGRSDPLPSGRRQTLEERASDLLAVMDAVDLERAALFATHDGGPVAILAAATWPHRVSALILCNTWARLRVADDQPFGVDDATAEMSLTLLPDVWGTGATLDTLAPSIASEPEVRAWWARSEQMTASRFAAAELLQLALDSDVRAVLGGVQAPTAVVHTRDNRFAEVALGRDLAERIDGARFVAVEGTDHIFWFSSADAVLDVLEEQVAGAVTSVGLTRAVTTVLFTDIVDSTARAAAAGDQAWRRLLDQHDVVVRRELARYGGTEIDHAGDGFFATFDGAALAIRCADSIRQSLRPLDISIRAGIHTGEVERRGDRVTGLAVHIGARVSAQGKANEIVVSRTVRDLVVGSGISFKSRGSFELKGIPEEWELLDVLSV